MNTSASWFTSYERSLLKTDYGTQRQRLSRDQSKPIDSCNLCLQRSRDPVCCASHGDVFCRECAISNLLAQRKEIKRMQRDIEKRLAEEEEDRRELEKEAVERGIREFEEVQMGLEKRRKRKAADEEGGEGEDGGGAGAGAVTERVIGREAGKIIVEREEILNGDSVNGSSKKKQKFELDESELLRIARSDRQRLKTDITSEKEVSSAPKLPSFWLPSLTPSLSTAELAPTKVPKLQPVCPASDPDKHHYFNLKTLVTLHFEEEEGEKTKHGEKMRICPSCRKGLSNEFKAIVAKPCGHVLCKPCVEKFVMTPEDPHAALQGKSKISCFVCAADLTEKPSKKEGKDKDKEKEKEKEKVRPGLVQISSDGTGFTGGGGRVLAQKGGVAFQC